LRPVPVDAVAIDDAFWAPRRRTNREVSLPAQYRLLEETGRVDNFRRAAGKSDGPFHGRYFNDSDVYKWLEAAAWALGERPDPGLAGQVDGVIEEIAAAQRPDGYLNSYFAGERAGQRWTDPDLHELYCAGHLVQAAVAHHRATGGRRLLGVATRFADHVCDRFGPAEAGKRPWADGHPEIELALVELFRETGERRYLDQARFFVDVRGRGLLGRPFDRWGPEYHQDHRPFRELDEIVGHAVRAVYLNAGVTDLVLETGDPALRAALDRLWANMTERKQYVSGGLGARYEGEAFGADWELPNARAYAETCAAIASVMWNWRMLLLTGEARYADHLEWTLYNGVLPGVSLDGGSYFYQNPLEDDGGHRRRPWFGTACCPPNVARLLASLPGYCYAVAADAVWVHLYAAGSARLSLADGRAVSLRQRTGYPWQGEVSIVVDGVEGDRGEVGLRLRVPGWCEAAALSVNGEPVGQAVAPGGYAEVRRRWRAGDVVRLSLPMPVRRLAAHPRVAENAGRVALSRGPLLYCLEAVDHPGVDPRDVRLPGGGELRAEPSGILNGAVVLRGEAVAAPPGAEWRHALYRPADGGAGAAAEGRPIPIAAVPYHAWANREAGPMAVWLRRA